VEVGYFLHPAAWGLGYATELMSACSDLADHALELREVRALARPENVRSPACAGEGRLWGGQIRSGDGQAPVLARALKRLRGAMIFVAVCAALMCQPPGSATAVAITASGRCSASYLTPASARESRRSASRKFATRIMCRAGERLQHIENSLRRGRIQVVHQGYINRPYILR
jgi:hypothetical protein